MSDEIAKTNPLQFSEFVKTLSDQRKTVKNCRLCNSKHRDEAEEKAERGISAMQIWRDLVAAGEDIKYGSVINHINEHLKTQQINGNLKSMASRVAEWDNFDHSDESLLKHYIKTLNIEYNTLLAQNPALPPAEQRKNLELMLKITTAIDSYRKSLHELQADQRPVEIFYHSLHRIVEFKLKNIRDPETKRILFDILNEMEREVGEVSTDGRKLLEAE